MDENTSFARCYMKSDSSTFCAKLRFQSQPLTFLPWNSKPTFSTESAGCGHSSSLHKQKSKAHLSEKLTVDANF